MCLNSVMFRMMNTFHWNLNNQSALCLDLLQFHLQLALLIWLYLRCGLLQPHFCHLSCISFVCVTLKLQERLQFESECRTHPFC